MESFISGWTFIQDRWASAVRRGAELKYECADLGPNTIVEGPIFPEPIEISMTVPLGESVKIIGRGLRTGRFYDPVLSPEQLKTLRNIGSVMESFDGDAFNFRLGIEALRLGMAHEYDPFFSLSIARVDPGNLNCAF
ncbi:MAG: Helicase domain protein [Methanothrix harundinacea]|uniref:Helicase domain protein n=1 Tax=Methanothrix harundinacea TaxID=301375 RepID=A0A124G2M5_9EURY|nr:MAG: Helicase domain protein [Methanothrix harundinacea]